MKKLLAIMLVVCMLLTMVACKAGDSASKTENKAKDDTVYTIRIAIVSSDSHLHNIVLNEWAADALEKTDGRLVLQVMGSSQLGGERDYVEGMQLGSIEMCQVSSGPVASFLPDFNLLSFPYFFEDYAAMEEVFNGEVSEYLFDQLETMGIKGLTWFTNGYRSVYSNKEVHKPEDLNGLKIRVMESNLMIETLNAMGASAMPMAYSELYSAIQQGVMDGAENSLGNIMADKYYEICKNVSLTEHFAPPGVVAISMETYNKLPADLQEYLVTSALEFGKLQRERDEVLQEETADALVEAGCTVNEVDKDAFVAATEGIYSKFAGDLNPELIEIVERTMGKNFG